jgi:elongation factor Ts
VTLLAQPFVKGRRQADRRAAAQAQGATVNGFTLFVVGEGIEKKKDDLPPKSRRMAKA